MSITLAVGLFVLMLFVMVLVLGGVALFFIGKTAWEFFLEVFEKIHGR